MSSSLPFSVAHPHTRVAGMIANALLEVVASTSAIVAMKNLEGRYIYVNDAFLRLLGGAREDYLGCSDAEIFDPATAEALCWNDRQVFEELRDLTFQEDLEIAGQRRAFAVRKYPLRDPAGVVWGVGLSATEVTDSLRTDEALRSIAVGISAATGPRVFDLTVSSLSRALGVDLAFVSAIAADVQPTRLDTLSLCTNGQPDDNESYAAAGTPCERVLQAGFQYFSGNALEQFPDDGMLLDRGFTSYAGYPLIDSLGAPIGVLAVAHRGPLPERGLVETLLGVFAVRAGAELERVRMDQALRESEASYRAIFEASDDCIFVHDIDTGAIVDVNPRVTEIYGYDYHDILRMHPGQLGSGQAPFDLAGARAWLDRARQGEVVRFEWQRRNRDGTAAWDAVTLKRVRIGGVDRILAVTRDISERKEREQALTRSQERLRATVEAALDSIVTMDEAGRIRDVNPAAERAFGFSADQVRGRSLAELIVPERYRGAYSAALSSYLRDGRSGMIGRRVELTAQRADGTEFPVEVAIGVAGEGPNRLFIGYLRDITERQIAERARERLELKLRQAQKMEAIGHLTGGIAHDFNNILTGIMGYLAMATDRARELGDPHLPRYLERARHSGARAAELIQQMLTFSRGQRGDPRPLDLEPVVRESLRLLHSTLPATIEIAAVLDGAGERVLADPVQVEQVLMNLCINARDAMGGRGRIRLSLRPVEPVDWQCSVCQDPVVGRFLELAATDSGPGVPEALLGRIFDPFFSTKPPGQGSGMGLATVHGIVHEHGGHLVVANQPEGGASFRVLLPVLGSAAARDAADGRSAPASAGLAARRLPAAHLLLVEDDDTAREFMTELLGRAGLQVSSYSDPRQALQALAAPGAPAAPDLALLDYTMPHMNGVELACRLREWLPTLPVVLYSGLPADLPPAAREAAGIVAMLNKPVDVPSLFATLETVLQG